MKKVFKCERNQSTVNLTSKITGKLRAVLLILSVIMFTLAQFFADFYMRYVFNLLRFQRFSNQIGFHLSQFFIYLIILYGIFCHCSPPIFTNQLTTTALEAGWCMHNEVSFRKMFYDKNSDSFRYPG